MSHIDWKSFCNIQGWMVTKYGLHGDKLIAFAVIYGFSKDGAGWYFGGREYIAEWIGCSDKRAGRALAELLENGLIERVPVKGQGNAGKCYRYRVTIGDETEPITGQDEYITSHSVPYIGDETALINIRETKKENKRECKRFTPPTREEVAEYAREKSYNGFPVDRFIAYYESNGWMVGRNKMKSWKASMTNWWCRDHQTEKHASSPDPRMLALIEEGERERQRRREAMICG